MYSFLAFSFLTFAFFSLAFAFSSAFLNSSSFCLAIIKLFLASSSFLGAFLRARTCCFAFNKSFLALTNDCSAFLLAWDLLFLIAFNRFNWDSCFESSDLAIFNAVCCLLNSDWADFKTFNLDWFCFVKSARRFLVLSRFFWSVFNVVLAIVRFLFSDEILSLIKVSSFFCFRLKLSRASLAFI